MNSFISYLTVMQTRCIIQWSVFRIVLSGDTNLRGLSERDNISAGFQADQYSRHSAAPGDSQYKEKLQFLASDFQAHDFNQKYVYPILEK